MAKLPEGFTPVQPQLPEGFQAIRPALPEGFQAIDAPAQPAEPIQNKSLLRHTGEAILDIPNVFSSAVVGGLQPVAETVAKPFTGQTGVDAVRSFFESFAPRSVVGKAVIEGVSLPFTYLHKAIVKTQTAMGVSEPMAEELATGMMAGIVLGTGAHGLTKPKPTEPTPVQVMEQFKARRKANEAIAVDAAKAKEFAGKPSAIDEIMRINKELEDADKGANPVAAELNKAEHGDSSIYDYAAVNDPAYKQHLDDLIAQHEADLKEFADAPVYGHDVLSHEAAPVTAPVVPVVPEVAVPVVDIATKNSTAVKLYKRPYSQLNAVEKLAVDEEMLGGKSTFVAPKVEFTGDIKPADYSGHDVPALQTELTKLTKSLEDIGSQIASASEDRLPDLQLRYSIAEVNAKAAATELGKREQLTATAPGIEKPASATPTQLPKALEAIVAEEQTNIDAAINGAVDGKFEGVPVNTIIGDSKLLSTAPLEYFSLMRDRMTAQINMGKGKLSKGELSKLEQARDSYSDIVDKFEKSKPEIGEPTDAQLRAIEAETDAALAELDAQIWGDTPAAVQDVAPKQAILVDTTPHIIGNLRENGVAAYRTLDGQIFEGATHSEALGKLMGTAIDKAIGAEQGWLHGKDFTPEAFISKSTVPNKVAKKKVGVLANLIDKLSEERGSLFGKQSAEFTPEGIADLRRFREAALDIQRRAKSAKKTTEQYLRDNGASDDAIEAFHGLIKMEIRDGEVMGKASPRGIRLAHVRAEKLGLDLNEVKRSVGLVDTEGKPMSMKSMTYLQERLLNAKLRMIEAERVGGEMTEHDVRIMLEADQITPADIVQSSAALNRTRMQKGLFGIKTKVNSPVVALRESEVGAALHRVTDEADMLTKRHNEQVFSKHGLGMDAIYDLKREHYRVLADALEGKISRDNLPVDVQKILDLNRKYYQVMKDEFVASAPNSSVVKEIVKQEGDAIRYKPHENSEHIQAILAEYKRKRSLTRRDMEAIELLRSEERFYMPHVFDKDTVIAMLKDTLAISKDAKEIARTKDRIAKLQGGELVLYSQLPGEVKFGHLEKRLGAEGYVIDPIKAFERYHYGMLKKLYMEPALQKVKVLYEQLPAYQKPFAKQYLQDIFGWKERSYIPDFIKQVEYIRTLGFNFRSAVNNAIGGSFNNLTQAAAHPIIAARGIVRAHTSEGVRAFRASGAPREIASVNLESIKEGQLTGWRKGVETGRIASGWMFNQVEFMNRNVAYNIGAEMARTKGLKGDDAFFYAMNEMHTSQFRYGKVGMPIGLRGWGGAVFQFSSYPIKQFEFMAGIVKEAKANPREGMPKLLALVGLQVGAPIAAYMAGADISGGAGIPGLTSVASAQDMVKSLMRMTQGDWDDAKRHFELAVIQGNGIFPSFPPLGPAVKSLYAIGTTKDSIVNAVMKEMEPTQAAKFRDFVTAIKYEKDGKYPIFSYKDNFALGVTAPFTEFKGIDFPERKYTLDMPLLLMRTFGPKPSIESEMQRVEFNRKLMDGQSAAIIDRFQRAIAAGDTKAINSMMNRYPMQAAEAVSKKITNKIINARMKFELSPAENRLLHGEIGSKKWINRQVLENRD